MNTWRVRACSCMFSHACDGVFYKSQPRPRRADLSRAPSRLAQPGTREGSPGAPPEAGKRAENPQHARLDRERTWTDDTTHAIHESQTLRIERVHEADPRETAWTVASYETPVSDRMWHLTMTGATPAPVLKTLLNGLADEDAWETAIGSPTTEKTVTAATRPLTDAGWKHTLDGRWIRWETLQGDVGVQFDAFAAQNLHSTLA
ncbi:DUF317 domain-containing protein, partial [Streptomyces sp. NPDC006135]